MAWRFRLRFDFAWLRSDLIGATHSLVGLPAGIQRFVSFYKGKGNKGRIKGTIFGALKISFPLSLVFAFLFFFLVTLLVLGFGVIGAAWGWVLAIVLMPFLAIYFLEKRVFPVFNTKVKTISVN